MVMIVIVVGIFFICWFFYLIGVFCFFDLKWCNLNDFFYVLIIWLVMLNSVMNLLIYGLMNRSF